MFDMSRRVTDGIPEPERKPLAAPRPGPDLRSYVERLKRHQGVLAVVAFGSAARGEMNPLSDVDILVVRNDSTRSAEVREAARLASDGTDRKVSTLVLSQESLRRKVEQRPSFGAHLVREGSILYLAEGIDRGALLDFDPPSEGDLRREAERDLELLNSFSHLERFNGEYAPVMAHLYAIARSIVIIKLLSAGVHEYSWQRAFNRLAEFKPPIKGDLKRIADLRSVYEYVRGRTPPPAADDIQATQVRQAVASIRRVAHA